MLHIYMQWFTGTKNIQIMYAEKTFCSNRNACSQLLLCTSIQYLQHLSLTQDFGKGCHKLT